MTFYEMAINNIANYHKKHIPIEERRMEKDEMISQFDAFQSSSILSVVFCKSKEEILMDIANTSIEPLKEKLLTFKKLVEELKVKTFEDILTEYNENCMVERFKYIAYQDEDFEIFMRSLNVKYWIDDEDEVMQILDGNDLYVLNCWDERNRHGVPEDETLIDFETIRKL